MRSLPWLRMRALLLTLLLLASLLPLAPTSQAHFCPADDAIAHARCVPECVAHSVMGHTCSVECLGCRIVRDLAPIARIVEELLA